MISLVVVNYRSTAWLERLLPTAGDVDQVVVVDHSEDTAEADRLRRLPVDRVLALPNRGYGAGLNAGAAEASGDTLILANPDVQFEPGAIPRLAQAASQPGVGIAGPTIYWDPSLRWRLPHATHLTWCFELAAHLTPRLARRAYLRQQQRGWTATAPVSVPAVGGAAMAVSRAALDEVGGFDERFFLFFEENDLCRRFRAAGRRVLVVPSAGIVHPFGRSIGDAAGAHYARSLELFRRQHFPALYRTLFPAPPRPRTPPTPPSADDLRDGDEILLTSGPGAIPAARAVARDGDPAPERLIPASVERGRYLLLRRRGHRLGALRWVQAPG